LSSNRWNESKVAALALSAVCAIEAMKDEEDNNDNRRKDGRDFAGGVPRLAVAGKKKATKMLECLEDRLPMTGGLDRCVHPQ
jgi:hypothetical protein